ncbi:MAG: isocitrate/isopropylmalate family dehydrogenase [Gammaproteobacteria bacterium]
MPITNHPNFSYRRWSDDIGTGLPPERPAADSSCLIGVFNGEGVGAEVVGTALRVLNALGRRIPANFTVRRFESDAGIRIERDGEAAYSRAVSDFCRGVFEDNGAILAGPVGGRFVYDLRRNFNLYCKLVPLQAIPDLKNAARIKSEFLDGTDILVVRDNASGLYQGSWNNEAPAGNGRIARHQFSYSEHEVQPLIETAARIASRRRGNLAVIVKDGGAPSISELWRQVGNEVCAVYDIAPQYINVDYAAYYMIQHAQQMDVIVTPNLFGDILADLGGILMGSRGLSYSANYSPERNAVYQTGHGAAFDLAGKDLANPVGQIFSLTMMLHESFGLTREALLIENAVFSVWREGWRTQDVMEAGARCVGTLEMGDLIVDALDRLADSAWSR